MILLKGGFEVFSWRGGGGCFCLGGGGGGGGGGVEVFSWRGRARWESGQFLDRGIRDFTDSI